MTGVFSFSIVKESEAQIFKNSPNSARTSKWLDQNLDSESESRVYALTLLGKKGKLCTFFSDVLTRVRRWAKHFVPISLRGCFKYYPHFRDVGTIVWEVCNSPQFLQQEGRGNQIYLFIFFREPDLNPDPSGCTVRICSWYLQCLAFVFR